MRRAASEEQEGVYPDEAIDVAFGGTGGIRDRGSNLFALLFFSSYHGCDCKQKLSMKTNARCVKLAVRKSPNSGLCNGLT